MSESSAQAVDDGASVASSSSVTSESSVQRKRYGHGDRIAQYEAKGSLSPGGHVSMPFVVNRKKWETDASIVNDRYPNGIVALYSTVTAYMLS